MWNDAASLTCQIFFMHKVCILESLLWRWRSSRKTYLDVSKLGLNCIGWQDELQNKWEFGNKIIRFFHQPILCTVLIYLVRDPATWQRLRSHDCISSDTQQHKVFVTTFSFHTFLSLVVPGFFFFNQTYHHHLLLQSFRDLGPWIMAWILFES